MIRLGSGFPVRGAGTGSTSCSMDIHLLLICVSGSVLADCLAVFCAGPRPADVILGIQGVVLRSEGRVFIYFDGSSCSLLFTERRSSFRSTASFSFRR